jgi:hypothetical protein
MRSALAYFAELAGFACLVYAAYLVSLTLGLAVLGVGLILGAQAGRR